MASSEVALDSLTLPTMALDSLNFTNLEHDFTADSYTDEVQTDDYIDTWPLMGSPVPILTITLLYLVFVLKLGPEFMKTRPAFKLRKPILLYNGALIVFSSWWIYKTVTTTDFSGVVACTAPPRSNHAQRSKLAEAAWYYSMSKLVEFLDTVLFVLRKKQNQVSFLHVYHHSNMALTSWVFLAYVRDEKTVMIGMVNTAVHAVMYSYYFIAALGPKFRSLLWFKPIITRIQIVQFVFIIGYLVNLLVFSCNVPRGFMQYCVFNTFVFLVLFAHFYFKTYVKPRSARQNGSAKNAEKMHKS